MVDKKGMLKFVPILVLMAAQIGSSADNTSLGLMTSALIDGMHTTIASVELTQIVYSLVTGSLMVFGGMLGLAIGWKRCLLLGCGLFALGEFVAAFAPSITILIWIARTIAGIGGSLLVPAILGLCVVLYSGKDRALAFGAIGAALGLASVIAPVAAGLLINAFGCSAVFSALGLYFVLLLIWARVCIPRDTIADNKIRLDLKGAVLCALGLFFVIIGISKMSAWGIWAPFAPPFKLFGLAPTVPLITVGLLLLWALYKYELQIEKKYASCLIPSSFTRNRQVRAGLTLTMFMFFCFGAILFLLVAWVQLVGLFSAGLSALTIIVMAVPMIIFAIGIPKLALGVSPRKICFWALAASALGCSCMYFGYELNGINALAWVGLVAFGVSQGMLASQVSIIIAQAVNTRDAAQSGGVQASARNIGQALGVAIIGVVLLFSLSAHFKSNVQSLAIPLQLKAKAQQVNIYQLKSNQEFTQMLHENLIPDVYVPAVLKAYEQARLSAAHTATVAFLAIILLNMLALKGVPANL